MILVVVGDFDFISLAALPAKAEPVLVVDADGISALPVSAERVQAVAWWYAEVVERGGGLELGEFTQGGLVNRRGYFGRFLTEPEEMGGPAGERGDHRMRRLCTLSVQGVKDAMHDKRV
jgi:hypothetical protein